jgi:hypothetical protein
MDAVESRVNAALRGKDQATALDDEAVGVDAGFKRMQAASALEWSGTVGKEMTSFQI